MSQNAETERDRRETGGDNQKKTRGGEMERLRGVRDIFRIVLSSILHVIYIIHV